MKILILKPSSLGDVIQALPVLRMLKRYFPQSHIHWWIEAGLAPLLENDPDLSGIIRFHRRRWAAPKNWVRLWRDIRWVRAQRFDWVIDLQSLARSAAFAWVSNGQLLVGLDEVREGARGFYDIVVPRGSHQTHAVDWYLAVLTRLGVPVRWDFEWLPSRPDLAQKLRQRWGRENEQWIVLQPGARWLNKRWPLENFALLVKNFPAAARNVRFVVLGSEAEKPLGSTIQKAAPDKCLDLTGQLSLPEMLECIRLSQLVVTNDTGPMHAAAAMRKPLIALFGPTDPQRTGPYGQPGAVLQSRVRCVPCLTARCHNPKQLECLEALTPELVTQRIDACLKQ